MPVENFFQAQRRTRKEIKLPKSKMPERLSNGKCSNTKKKLIPQAILWCFFDSLGIYSVSKKKIAKQKKAET